MENMEEQDMVFSLKGPSHWEKDALSNRQKEEMARIMFDVNSDDERYIRGHPEIEYIIAAVVMAAVEKPPKDALRFAVEYLAADNLKERVMKQTESYRLDAVAKRRLYELDYGGKMQRYSELDLLAGQILTPNLLKETWARTTSAEQTKSADDQNHENSTGRPYQIASGEREITTVERNQADYDLENIVAESSKAVERETEN